MEDESHLVPNAKVSIQTVAWIVLAWHLGVRRPGGHGQSDQQWDLGETQAPSGCSDFLHTSEHQTGGLVRFFQ